MIALRPLLCAVVALLLAAPAAALAQDLPALTGRVVDQANLLSPEQEQALTARLEALEQASSRQLVVATVTSLQDRPIEDYANTLFRSWRLGQEAADNGVLLLVAPSERKVRIEVGYGLEAILTDALTGQIIRTDILPRFRDSDYAGGIEAGANALIEQLQAPPEAAEERARSAAASRAPRVRSDESINPLPILFAILIVIFVVVPIFAGLAGIGGRKYGRRYRRDGGAADVGRAVGEIILWTALNQLAHGGGRGGWGGGGRWGGGSSWGGGGGGSSWGGGGGGFSGGGGSSGGGGASGSW